MLGVYGFARARIKWFAAHTRSWLSRAFQRQAMSARDSSLSRAVACFGVWLLACCFEGSAASTGKTESVKSAYLAKTSGYRGGVADWHAFLDCWRRNAERRSQNESSDSYLSILGRLDRALGSPEMQSSDVDAEIRLAETRLAISLPKSYRDFLSAFRPPALKPFRVSWGTSLIGFYSVAQVDRLSVTAPQVLGASKRHAIDSADDDYYKYGVAQRTSAGRTQHLSQAIVVGKYGDAAYELLVLYPPVMFADDEMEAAMIFHTGEFRAPSFAELMRQLSFYELNTPELLPPYAQRQLAGTCAERLPIAAWWQ